MSHYRVLGIPRNASEEEIRAAYKVEVVKAHPDKGGTPQRFKEVQKAYETLKNRDSRRDYDAEITRTRIAKNFKRPPPLEHVKNPVQYCLPDGELYVFDSAPDRLRCRFRHGDIVSNGMETGCFIGLGAYDTLYWIRDGAQFATRLFSLGMGEEKHVDVVFRANAPRRTSSVPVSARSTGLSGSAASRRPPQPNSPAPDQTLKEPRPTKAQLESSLSERLRLLEQKRKRLVLEECYRRRIIEDSVAGYLREVKKSQREWKSQLSTDQLSPRDCPTTPSTMVQRHTRKASSVKVTVPPPLIFSKETVYQSPKHATQKRSPVAPFPFTPTDSRSMSPVFQVRAPVLRKTARALVHTDPVESLNNSLAGSANTSGCSRQHLHSSDPNSAPRLHASKNRRMTSTM